MRARRTVLILLVAGLAGCAQPASGPDEGEAPAVALRLELTGCEAWSALSPPFAQGTSPGEAPRGWETSAPYSSVRMEGYECERISLGRFERGPIRLVLDEHSALEPPQGCGLEGSFWMLSTLWVDDDEIAWELAQAYGLPARFSAIQEDVQAAPAGDLRSWTWGPGGGSTLRIPRDGLAGEDLEGFTLYWARGEGIGRLAVAFDGREGSLALRPAEGTLAPPMLMSFTPGGRFAGHAKWFGSDFAAAGDISLFADRLCQARDA